MKAVGGRQSSRAILMAACAAALGGAFRASASDVTWSGANANNSFWSTATNWVGNTAPVAHDSLIFDGFARLTPNNDFAAATAFDSITFAPSAGAFNLFGNQITLSGNIIDNTAVLPQTITMGLLLDGNRSVDVTNTGSLSIDGAISGGFGITKTGAGTLVLTGANTFTGNLAINAGVVSVSSDANLGATNAGATRLVIDNGSLLSTGIMTINSARGIALGNAGSGGGTILVSSGNTVNYGGVISNNGGSGSLTKLLFGNLALSGANTYTGATNLRNGGLTLNFADAPATTPLTNIISPSSTLVMGGATAGLGQINNSTLTMTGKAGAVNSQTFNNTLIDIYASAINVTKGTGGSATLNLGALTHNPGGSVVISTGSGNSGIVNTTTPLTNGILGGWAIAGVTNLTRGITQGTDWATVDGSGNVVAYNAYVTGAAYDGTAATLWKTLPAIVGNADKNIKIVGAATPASPTEWRVDADNAGTTTDINTLNYQTNNQNHVLTIGLGNRLRLGKYGGIFKSTNANFQIFIGGAGGNVFAAGVNANAGNLTAGGPAIDTPGEIDITQNEANNNSGTITIVSNIVDNGTGAVTLVKNGVGSSKIDGHNSYTGGTFITQGRLQLAGSEQLRDPANPSQSVGNPDGLGTGPVFVAPGAYLYISGVNGAAVYTGPGAIPGARAGSAQNAPMLNNFTISGNGTDQEPIGAIRFGNRSLVLGDITLGGDARVGGGNAAAYPAIKADGTTLYIDPGNLISGKITGPFSFDVGSAVSIATNFIISNPANDWTGNTSFIGRTGGTASVTRLRLGANEVIPHGTGKGNVLFGNTGINSGSFLVLDMQGYNETINGLSTVVSPDNAFIENNGFTATIVGDPGAKTYSFTATTSTLTVGGFDQSANFGGTVRDSDTTIAVNLPEPNGAGGNVPFTAPWSTAGAKVALTKIGTGVQTLSGFNSYTGDTNINNGTLAVTGQLAQNGKVNINTSASAAGSLSGTGSVGDVTMAANVGSNKATLAPGAISAVGTIGTLSMNSLTVNGGNIAIDVGQGISDVIIVSGPVTFSGPSTISPAPSGAEGDYTILQTNNPITYTVAPTLVLPTLTRNTFGLTSSLNAIILNVHGGSKALNWTGSVNGKWDIVGFQNWNDNTLALERFFNGDAVTFGDVNTNRNLILDATVLPSSVTFTNTNASDYTLSGAGAISGSANFSKSGNGKLTINTNNTYSGTTQISEGTIQVGTGGTLGSLGSGNITNNGSLIFNRSDAVTLNQSIDGSGGLTKQGAGTLRLGGSNGYSAGTTIEQGTIVVTNGNSLGGGAVTINSGGALDISGDGAADDLNFQGKPFSIAGTGVNGTGALTNSGNVGQQNAFQQVVLSADTTVGGTGRFDIRVGDPNNPGLLDLATHTLTKAGRNQVSLFNVNVTDGNIVVNEGIFGIQASTSIPDNGPDTSITFNAGTTAQFAGNVRADGAAGSPVMRQMNLNGGVTIGNSNNNVAALIGSNIKLGGNVTVDVLNGANTATLVLLGNIGETGGARSITKNGTTTLVLSGSNTYSGGTTISAGTLQVNNTAGSATGTGLVTLGADTTLTGNGTIAGTVIASGTTHIVPADGITTLTLDGMSLAEGTTLDFEGNATNFDRINLTGTNTFTFSGNAIMNLTEAGSLNEGTFTLIDYNGAPIGNLTGKLTLANTVLSGWNATLIDDPVNTAIKIKLENPNGAPQWFVDGNGSWSLGNNWSSGLVPDGAGATARMLGAITAARTIMLDGDRTIGTLVFDNANKYTIATGTGGTLTIGDASNSGGIIVVTGNHEISAAVAVAGTPVVDIASGQSLNLSGGVAIAAGKSLTKSGQGTLRIGGTQSHAAGAALVAQQGTVQLDSNQGAANSAAGSNLAVSVIGNPGATASTVVVNADQDLSSLSISTADGGTQTFDLHSPAGAGQFHLVRVYAADLNAAKASLSAGIRNANAAGVLDPLDGIVDSGLHAGSGIGIAVQGDHVTIRPTRVGDLNLDGAVTISDFIDLASNFNATGKTWQEGDLNNDGSVTISDFIDLASNFNSSYAGSIGPVDAADMQTLASFASSVGVDPSVIGSAVPEPASLSLLAIGAVGLLRRRQRRA